MFKLKFSQQLKAKICEGINSIYKRNSDAFLPVTFFMQTVFDISFVSFCVLIMQEIFALEHFSNTNQSIQRSRNKKFRFFV